MSVLRLDNVAVVVDDLEAAVAFFEDLGLELEGRAIVDGPWVEGVVGLDGVITHIAMMAVPGGPGRVELTWYESPEAVASAAPQPNTLGMTRMMFTVTDIDDTVARLERHGASVLRQIVDYGDAYRLCYLRGPSGIIVALAQPLKPEDG